MMISENSKQEILLHIMADKPLYLSCQSGDTISPLLYRLYNEIVCCNARVNWIESRLFSKSDFITLLFDGSMSIDDTEYVLINWRCDDNIGE